MWWYAPLAYASDGDVSLRNGISGVDLPPLFRDDKPKYPTNRIDDVRRYHHKAGKAPLVHLMYSRYLFVQFVSIKGSEKKARFNIT